MSKTTRTMRTIAPTPMYMTFPLLAVDVRSTDRPLPVGLRTARSWPVQTSRRAPPGRAWPGWRAGGTRARSLPAPGALPAATAVRAPAASGGSRPRSGRQPHRDPSATGASACGQRQGDGRGGRSGRYTHAGLPARLCPDLRRRGPADGRAAGSADRGPAGRAGWMCTTAATFRSARRSCCTSTAVASAPATRPPKRGR